MTTLPAATCIIETEDMTVDLVCFNHAFACLRNRVQAGKLKGYVEATLEANPGLATKGAILPLLTIVKLPEFVVAAPQTQVKRLWDY